MKPRYAWRAFSPRSRRAAPTTLLAGAGLAAVLLLVAALAVAPRFQMTPAASGIAGYPADRALTTAELAALMAGPALPANTALVADVVIDIRTDVCPMDRYGTVGIVEGMASQVCVMTASDVLIQPVTIRGIMAFRNLAPGVLGLLGEITPASPAKVAFRVADDWPLQGKTFLVEGWLGAEGLVYPCASIAAGDVLSPNGEDCPNDNWLSDDPSAPLVGTSVPIEPQSTGDALQLHGNARVVEAGGMRQIDSIDHAAPVHGVYVVRSVTEGCPGDPPQSSRGCGAWRVLAKVADVSVPMPVATPVQTPSPTPPAATPPPATPPNGYPVDRALTAAELAAVMAGPALPVDTTLVAEVTIDSSESGAPGCVSTSDYSTIGLVHGMPTRICVFGGGFSPARVPGIFAFRYLGPGALYLLAQVTPASSSRLVFRPSEAWPWSINGWDTFLVGGYLIREPTGSRIVDTPSGPTASSSLTPQSVQVDDNAGIDSTDPSQYGVFVVICEPALERATSTSTILPNGNGVSTVEIDGIAFHVVARVADISVPGASAAPLPSPSSGPSSPPATPVAPSLTGVIGTGNQPLTADELETLMVSRPDHLAGRIVIVEAPIPTQISCQSDASGGGCAVNTKSLAEDGVWAIGVGADGTLSLVGQISTPAAGGYVFTLDQVNAATNLKASDSLIVDGWLVEHVPTCDYDPPLPSACGPFSEIASTASDNSPASFYVQQGAFEEFTAIAGWTVEGPPVHGLFLVRVSNPNGGTLVASLEPLAP